MLGIERHVPATSIASRSRRSLASPTLYERPFRYPHAPRPPLLRRAAALRAGNPLGRARGRAGGGRRAAVLDHGAGRGLARLGRRPAARRARRHAADAGAWRPASIRCWPADRTATRAGSPPGAWRSGVFEDAAAAIVFRDELFAALAAGIIATGRAAAVRRPRQPAGAPTRRRRRRRACRGSAARRSPRPRAALRAGRGLAAGLPTRAARRLATVALARCSAARATPRPAPAWRATRRSPAPPGPPGKPASPTPRSPTPSRSAAPASDRIRPPAPTRSAGLIAVAERGELKAMSPRRPRRRRPRLGDLVAHPRLLGRRRRARSTCWRSRPRGAVNVLAFEGPDGFNAVGFADRRAAGLPGARPRGPRRLPRRSRRRLSPRRRAAGGAGAGRRRRAERRPRQRLRQRRAPAAWPPTCTARRSPPRPRSRPRWAATTR